MSSSKSSPKDVAVILVGLNARDFIKQCLESLKTAQWRQVSYEIIYVDNGSSDGTPEMVRDLFPYVQLVVNEKNVGFCPAANQGARLSSARYYFFLNDDTIVLDDAIALLVEYLDEAPDVGVVGSRLLYPDMTEQWSGRKFPTMWNAILGRRTFLSRFLPNSAPVTDYLCKKQLQGEEPFEVDWISAAALMVRKECFDQVGGLAEDYYYWHEPVFCDRVVQSGKKVTLHPRSKIIHYEGKGSGPRPHKVRKFHIINFHDGAYRCYCDHYHLKPIHPARWFVFAALKTRALVLLTGSWLRSFTEKSPSVMQNEQQSGKPS